MMNIKIQIDVLPDEFSLRRWLIPYILILICISSKFQAVTHDRPIGDSGENIIYVTKGTTIFIEDPDMKIKQVFISKENKKTKNKFSKGPKTVKKSAKKRATKIKEVRAVAILYSKDSSSENDLSVQGRKNIFFIAAAGESQTKSALQESRDVLYVQNYLYETSLAPRRLDDLFLEHHFSESHAIRPPPVII